MRFRLLGPLEIFDGASWARLGAAKPRTLLAILLLRSNQLVPADELIDQIWPRPPETATNLLHQYVGRLRRTLCDPGAQLLVTRAPGYQLVVADPGDLDAGRFARLAAEGQAALAAGRAPQAAGLLREALGLWRGPALVDIPPAPLVSAEADRLEEQRLVAVEDRIAAELACGQHSSLVGELRLLVAAHPYRERLWSLLLQALHRSGRVREALAAYRDLYALLKTELGIQPSAELKLLHRQLLTRDPMPVLAVSAAPASAQPGRAALRAPGVTTAIPRQLPPDTAGFTGREGELACLDGWLAETAGQPSAAVISAVSGTAGVGKTALAVRWAHRAAGRFPDGQLYVDLRGYDPDQPMTAAAALARVLAGLGVAGPDVPLELDDRAARYRSELAGRRMLVVLDNAATVEQVRPLLPGSGSCAVVVTSRDSLVGLVAVHGARRLDLDLLPPAEAVVLLRRLIGPRVDAEPAAAVALAALCARLPLALRVAAELAASRPTSSLAELVADLGDRQHRLELLDGGGDPHAAVTVVFSWSTQHLPAPAARTFRLLGLHPGPDIDPYAAAALAGTGLEPARHTLDLLTRAHLIDPTGTGRYGMHDLLRGYATQLALTQDTEVDRTAALDRLFDYYLATAAVAMDRLYPAEADRRPRIPAPATPAPVLADPDTARTWLDAERSCLVAVAAHGAAHARPTHTTRLSRTLYRYLESGHYPDALAIHGHAHHAAEQAGDLVGQAHALRDLGATYPPLGGYGLAAEHLHRALVLFRQAGDRPGEATALTTLGNLQARLGRNTLAADHHQQARALFRRAGDRTGQAIALANLGAVQGRLGRYRQAGGHLRQALTLFRRLDNPFGQAHALNNLGLVEEKLGRRQLAANHLQQALTLVRRLGNLAYQAHVLDSLGTLHIHLGQPEPAAEQLAQALTLYRTIGDRHGQAQALNSLGEAAYTTGDPTTAITHHTNALTLATEHGIRTQQARAHTGLGHAHHTRGDPAHARTHYQHALTLYTSLDMPGAEDVRAHLAALDEVHPPGSTAPSGAGVGLP
jgi:DNA-binding SARP family transcriptional activator/Tfp pilus assembly protein PilF